MVIVTHNMQQAARGLGSDRVSCYGELIEYSKYQHHLPPIPAKKKTDYITGRYG